LATLALIVAAGRGERLGADGPKALVELAGRSLLQWSVDLMLGGGGGGSDGDGGEGENAGQDVAGRALVERVIVALPPGVSAPPGTIGVEGGVVRSESVARALAAAGPGDPEDLVVVHDAARPLAPVELVRRSLAVLAGEDGGGANLDAAIAAAPVADTVKRVGDGVVVETLDRSALWAVQTPQVFRRGALERALDVPADVLAQATDDAWLVERLGGRVAVVPAGSENLKITTPLDLALAELLVARRRASGRGVGEDE
jgi:2-C-methyl-D-erythritol 4-phosphate cytidylyltransferase